MSSEDSRAIIDKVTKLSGDLHHSVMLAKQFLKQVTDYKQFKETFTCESSSFPPPTVPG